MTGPGAGEGCQCIRQGSPEKETQQICTDICKRRVITISGSCGYRGQEVPRPAICKLETQESPRCNSVWLQGPENQEHWRPRAEGDGRPSSSRECEFTLPRLCVLFRPLTTGRCSSALLSLLIQILISPRDTLTDTPRNSVLPAIFLGIP